jgi:heterodisulfide reductase subunit B
MDIHVYDTYVEAQDGHTMHFDVITDVKDHKKAIEFAKEWLKNIGEIDAKVTTEECKFCHTQSVSEEVEIEIMTNGYFIAKMEGCPQ